MNRFLVCSIGAVLCIASAHADETYPSLSVSPSGSFILLEGTDLSGVEHVLHSEPSFGIGAELEVHQLLGGWSPKFDFSVRTIRFYGANGESIQYSTDYYTDYSVGLERQILDSWVASALVGYTDQLFVNVPSPDNVWIDKIREPEATLRTSAGVYDYKSYVFSVIVKASAYFPVSTPNYSAHLGYGVQPSISTSHVFSSHIAGSGEFYYQKRVQDTTTFNLTEQDFGIALTLLFD